MINNTLVSIHVYSLSLSLSVSLLLLSTPDIVHAIIQTDNTAREAEK
jgi:hypothetical protein